MGLLVYPKRGPLFDFLPNTFSPFRILESVDFELSVSFFILQRYVLTVIPPQPLLPVGWSRHLCALIM
jgi:hypothetical protein